MCRVSPLTLAHGRDVPAVPLDAEVVGGERVDDLGGHCDLPVHRQDDVQEGGPQNAAAMIDLATRPLDTAAMDAARARQNQLVKPPGSPGRLEELAIWLAGVTGEGVHRSRPGWSSPRPITASPACPPTRARSPPRCWPRSSPAAAPSRCSPSRSAPSSCASTRASTPTPRRSTSSAAACSPAANLTKEPALSSDDVTHAIEIGRTLAEQAAGRRYHCARRRRDGHRQHHARHLPGLLAHQW